MLELSCNCLLHCVKGSQSTGAACVSTWELPSQRNVTLREPGLQAVSGTCLGCHSLEQLKRQIRRSHRPCAHVLHKGALPWLMAAVSLAPVSKQEVEIVQSSLESLPKPKHFTCLLLTFASALRGLDFFQLSGNAGKSSISPK